MTKSVFQALTGYCPIVVNRDLMDIIKSYVLGLFTSALAL